MSSVEWNKKEELVTEQAIKLLKVTLHIITATETRDLRETYARLLSNCASEMF